tara:strand:- start:503 stop:721 length:219 start_codon:yes stop_codon:yes gene_type:complete
MVSKWKAVKEVVKGELKEIKEAFSQPRISTKYKKNIQKQKRSESRLAQRTGNKYMIGKKAINRPKGGWKTED